MESISYQSYDRITDVVFWFNNEITLKFITTLAKYGLNNERRFYSYEVVKPARLAYQDPSINITRNMTFYFVIDVKNDFNSSFLIRPGDAYMLTELINTKILPWFRLNTKESAYQYINDTLALTEYKQVIYTQSDIRYLAFDPTVIVNKDDKYSCGVRISISGIYTVEITLEKFFDFVRLLSTDMYVAACNLALYAKVPPYGTNLIQMRGLASGHYEDNWNEIPTSQQQQKQALPEKSSEPTSNSFLSNAKVKKGGKK